MPSPIATLVTALCALTVMGGPVGRGDHDPLPSVPHPAWAKSAVMYEVNIRQYTPEGTFKAFQTHLPRLKALGVDILWLMPVQPIGRVNRKGTLGSYYAIADYTAFNPELGTEADFIALVQAAHRLGLKVVLDWVANHTGMDHEWTQSHPDFYTRKADGSISHPVDPQGKETDWDDTADLNYGNAAMRSAMIGEMQWWLRRTGIDGFRCDVAGFVPTDFWMEVRRTLGKGRTDLFLLAEWEDPTLHAAFDMTYGWEFYHLMNDVAAGKKGATQVREFFTKERATFGPDMYRLLFTSNHDENSWQGTEFERMGANHQAAYVLSATVQGSMPLLYSGQERSFNRRLPFFEKSQIDWTGPSLEAFYGRLFALKHSQPALWNGAAGGEQRLLTTNGGERVVAFTRQQGKNSVVVAVNFGDVPVAAIYEGLPVSGAYMDAFDGAKVTMGAEGTLTIPAHGWRVLTRGVGR